MEQRDRRPAQGLAPSPQQAEAYLREAEARNPGLWVAHSQTAGRAARAIAAACGMDGDVAYSLGLLHDIGRREGVSSLRHVYDGWRFMQAEGWPLAARICLSHSFPTPRLDWYFGKNDLSAAQQAELEVGLAGLVQDDWDALVQLCDGICLSEGVCVMEKRLMDVVLRHGMIDNAVEKWKAYLALRDRFSAKMGHNLYDLFPECAAVSLQM